MSNVIAPIGGKVINVKVQVGDKIDENDEVMVIEAMKMELPVIAGASGTVKEIKCQQGKNVEVDEVLVVLE